MACVVVGVLSAYFAFFLYRSIYLIPYPYPTLYVEPYLLEDARLLGQGVNVYSNINEPPYLGLMYPPVFFCLVGSLFRLFGATYAVGRGIAFSAAALIGFLVYKSTLAHTSRRLPASVAALLFFAAHYVYTFVPDFRVDTLGVLLAVSGIYVVSRDMWSNWRGILVACILFSLALFTKQSLLAAPLAASLHFSATRQGRKAMDLAALFALIVLPVFVLLNHLTEGQFYQHTLVFHALPIDVERPLREIYKWLIMYPVVSGLVALGIAWVAQRRMRFSVWHTYFIVSLPITLVGASRVGVSINNFIELWAISCIVAGITLGTVLRDHTDKLATDLVMTLLIVQCVGVFHAPFLPQSIQDQYFFYQFMPPDERVSDAKELEARAELVHLIRTENLHTLSFIDGFGNFIDTTDSELVELSPEPFIFPKLRDLGLWDPDGFMLRIRNREFDLIVSKTLLADYPYDIEEYYGLSGVLPGYFVYEPRRPA